MRNNNPILTPPPWFLGIVIILCMVALNASTLHSYNFHRSEGNTVKHFGQNLDNTFPEIIESITKLSEDHVPVYFLSLSVWARLTGYHHPAMLSIFSILLGAFCLSIAYQIGVMIDIKWGGNILVFFFSFSSFALFYFHQVRMYALLIPLVMLVMISYWQIISTGQRTKLWQWISLYLSSTLLIYTHLSGMIILITLGLYHVLFVPKDQKWVQVGIVEILTGISFIPWLPFAIKGIAAPPDLSFQGNLFDKIYSTLFIPSNGLWWLVILAFIIAIVSWFRLTDKQRFFTFMGIGSLFVFFILDSVIGIFHYKYTLVLLPGFFSAATVGIIQLYRLRSQFLAIIIVLWLGMFAWYYQSPTLDTIVLNEEPSQYPPFYRIFRIDTPFPPGDDLPIVSLHADIDITQKVKQYFDRYYDRDIYHFVNFNLNRVGIQNNLKRLNNRYKSFLVLYSPHLTQVETLDVYPALTENFRSCDNLIDEPDIRFEYWVNRDIPCELVTPASTPLIHYNNDTELYNALAKVHDGQAHIYTWWDNLPEASYGYSIQIFDGENNKVAQSDTLLPTRTITEYTFDVSQLENATYRVDMIVYDSATVTSLAGTIMTTDTTFDRAFTIGEVIIQ